MSTPTPVAAVDLGATSGRVMVGHVGPDELRLEQVARFPNGPVEHPDGLHWDVDALYAHVLDGLQEAGRTGTIASIGIDAWAVDYGLLRSGELIDQPFHYRDERTAQGVDAVHSRVPFASLYAQNGLQFLPFNSLYQLTVDRLEGRLDGVESALLIPDLLAYRLTGERVAERTNASTTGLLSVNDAAGSRASGSGWNERLISELDLPRGLFPPLVAPGTRIGELLPAVADRVGYRTLVTSVGSHDTASAVVAVPMTEPNAAYISCGTWGLVGVELDRPVLTEASREANFTNEGGVDGRVRYLRNVMGLWLLNESMSTWASRGLRLSLPALLAEAEALTDPVPVFDPDDPRFMAPGDMPARIAQYCVEHGLAVPHSPAMFARSIVESLADAFARTAQEASDLSGKRVEVIHMVGGGAQNALLCQLTADRARLPVVAGPVEATAIGNVLVQARALGVLQGGLEELRELVARVTEPRRYLPRG